MKTFLSTALANHQANGSLTLAWFWVLYRRDGQVFGLTTDVVDQIVASRLQGIDNPWVPGGPAISMPTITGYAAGSVVCSSKIGFMPTDVALTDTLSQNNLDVTSAMGTGGITEQDVRAGRWSGALLEIGFYNWAAPTQGTNTILMGTLGDITIGDLTAKAELRSLSQPLEQNLDGVTSEMCDCKVFDTRCGVSVTPYLKTGTVAGWTGDRSFTDAARTEADGWWTKGELTFTSGAANGQAIEIKRSLSSGYIELVSEVYPGFANGDTYSATPGCNKLLWDATGACTGDCKVKYNNARRFRGFRVPGAIAIMQYGGQSDAPGGT